MYIKVTVIIPTLYHGARFSKLLDIVDAQTFKPQKIVIVDSASNAATAEIAESRNCKVMRIDKTDFDHGTTRNLAISEVSSEFAIFLTQDAMPVDEYMIVPHKERTFDKGKDCTSLEHLVEDFRNNNTQLHGDPNGHDHCWVTEDFVELINYMIEELDMKWEIVEVQDVDDKVGNGFTVVIRKIGTRKAVKSLAQSQDEK